MMWLLSILVMLLGFGFVIFWHELGHFLGARWAGIRVEQFAVGMGHAVVSYRKGIGIKPGTTMAEFERRTQAEFDAREIREKERYESEGKPYLIRTGEPSLRERYDIAKDLGLGETEYRLSSLPIGGYVKPTGQDDLRPAASAAADDPHSYAAAPVGKRMVMISAGVIMNVILAAILFFILFRFVGFEAMRPIVGTVQSGSPAAHAGLRAGDELLQLNGHTMHDFTKILMNVALLPDDEPVKLTYRRDGVDQTVDIQARYSVDNSKMLALGFSPAPLLRAIDPAKLTEKVDPAMAADVIVLPGERIVSVNGVAVTDTDYPIFDRAIQTAYGKPVEIGVKNAAGEVRTASVQPRFAQVFDRQQLSFLGATPRTSIAQVPTDSSATGRLQAGDVILSVKPASAAKPIELPTSEQFISTTRAAGAASDPLTFSVLRNGQVIDVPNILPATSLPGGGTGLGIGTTVDAEHAVVASAMADSPLKPGMTITTLAGQPVASWFDVHRVLSGIAQPGNIEVGVNGPAGTATFTMKVTGDELQAARDVRYAHPVTLLDEWTKVRETNSALTALGWGVGETRDLILQGYLTIRRVVTGSVPAKNMSGPVGILQAGFKFAQRGPDWFIWFLAVISANLAVVNFLPVPILDGWHFLSLLKEKITGRRLSERVEGIAQYVGLALILSLIVFVTYNDLARLIFGVT